MEFWEGLQAFIKSAFFLFVLTELTLVIEEILTFRLELRRGFSGTKSTPLRILSRHFLKTLRIESSFTESLAAGAQFLPVVLAAGLLPLWGHFIALPFPHSIWIFTVLTVAGPTLHLVSGWAFRKGTGWPKQLIFAERTVGCSTAHFILAITIVAITGTDSFSDMSNLQDTGGWLIWRYPMAIPILFSYSVANLFVSFQNVFSLSSVEGAPGLSFSDLMPNLWRSLWTLFVVDVFLGGAVTSGIGGMLALLVKGMVVNIVSFLASQLFFKLREDQAEALILWSLTPITIVILCFSLLFPGVPK